MMNISKIKINLFTYLFIILFIFSGFKKDLIILIFVFIIHEFGHLFFIKLFNVEILSIEIYPFGGMIKTNNFINYPIYKNILISSGGLLFQIILYFINLFFLKNEIVSFYNNLIFITNLIPVVPLDGSKIAYFIFLKFFSYYKSLIISYFSSTIILVLLILYKYNNIALIMYSFCFLVEGFKNISYLFHRFLLERYLFDFNFKKNKYYKNTNLKNLAINKYGFFLEKTWKTEKEILSKKFDNCSYIW